MSKTTISANGLSIEVKYNGLQGDYISLTDIAKYKTSENPGYVIQNWMRTRSTVRFLGLWERFHNPDFNCLEFEAIEQEAGLNSFVLTPKRWIESINAIGMISKQGRYAATFAHQDIAFEFASWNALLTTESKDNANFQQLVGIFQIPWGHHCVIMDYVKGDVDKALFFVRKTIENGWSRSMLLNWIDTGLYEREGKAITNFKAMLPEPMSDLAQEITKDPYNFAFAGITGKYNETLLKSHLLRNITDFLIELGTGFAYVGKEYRLQIGQKEKFIDLLFYHLNLRCYIVIEVKMGEFDFQDAGQLGGYVASVNHILKRDDDNPTIGLLICKSKDNLLAQYALESSSQPIGISDFELEKLYPSKVDGMIPTIKEIEEKLK